MAEVTDDKIAEMQAALADNENDEEALWQIYKMG